MPRDHKLRNLTIGAVITMSLLATSANAHRPDPTRASIHELLSFQARGELTCRDIAASVLARIHDLDDRLRVLITVNPRLMDDAQRLDAERGRRPYDLRAKRCSARRRAGSRLATCRAKWLSATSPYWATSPSTSARARAAMNSSRSSFGA